MSKKLKCILLVDDDSADNFFHKKVISSMGITDHVEVALDGESALTFLSNKNQETPEIIILDINMPRMNGWEFLEEYAKLTIPKNTVIIVMLTTSANPEDKTRADRHKVISEFNSKPLTEKMMSGILNKYYPEVISGSVV
jgi:CheY-like chemotaxis protein